MFKTKKTLNRMVAVLLAVLLLCGAAPAAGLAGIADFLSVTAAAESYSGTCGAEGGNVTWTLNTSTGVLTISGTGDMADNPRSDSAPWYEHRSSIQTVVIGSGVTSIGRYAFYGCTSLTSITIPDGVTGIDNGAFAFCESLTSVTIPDSVTSIGQYAFYCCESLTSIMIPDGVTSIGDDTFYKCTSLTSVTIPDGVTSIGKEAFYCCTSLTSVTIPDSVTSIGDYAFCYCTSLTSVMIPDGVTSIGDYAFINCISLRSIIIPDSVTRIGKNAFFLHVDPSGIAFLQQAYDNALLAGETDVYGILPLDGAKTILDHPNGSLTDVYYGGSQAQWKAIEIAEENDDLQNTKIHYNSIGIPSTGKVYDVTAGDLVLNYKSSGTITPDVKADSGAKYKVVYGGFDSGVISVDENGKVTANKRGSTEVTVTVKDDAGNIAAQCTCKVTVNYTFVQWLIIIFLFGFLWY